MRKSSPFIEWVKIHNLVPVILLFVSYCILGKVVLTDTVKIRNLENNQVEIVKHVGNLIESNSKLVKIIEEATASGTLKPSPVVRRITPTQGPVGPTKTP